MSGEKRKYLDFDYITRQATGNWVSRIFPAIGIKFKGNGKKHQPCPMCGGHDRFRCDDKKGTGTWICNQCGSGNGIMLVQAYSKKDAYEAHAYVADILGIDGGKQISEEEKQAWAKAQTERESAEKQAKNQVRKQVATIAQQRFANAMMTASHPYLVKKQVNHAAILSALRIDEHNNLLIPLYYHNQQTGIITLCNLQSISADGQKLFIKGGLKQGAYFALGQLHTGSEVVFVSTGFATAASIYLAMDCQYPVIVTFDDNNMRHCASSIRSIYPNSRLIFCADDDYKTAQSTGKNSGIMAGSFCATATGGEFIAPDFGNDNRIKTGELTDFNDLAVHFGLEMVKAQISHTLNHPKPTMTKNQDKPISDDLDKALARFAQIGDVGRLTNKIYDLNGEIEMTKTQFAEKVGKELSQLWLNHTDKKMISKDEVQEILSKNQAEKYEDIFNQYWYIQGTKDVFNHKTGKRQPIETLRLEYPMIYDMWMKSSSRVKVENDNIWFDPSCLKAPQGDEPYINTFKGMPLKPVTAEELTEIYQNYGQKVDCSSSQGFMDTLKHGSRVFVSLIEHLCGDDKAAADWVLNWLAIPLQMPGTKMDTALIVHGHIQGAGKSLFFDRVMRKIYGSYALTLGQGQLESQYNDWVDSKLFVVFEEIFQGKDSYSHMGMVKQLITGDSVYINKKFTSGWTQENFTNVVFLSNDMRPLSLEKNDRRHVVLYPKAVLPKNTKELISSALNDPKLLMIRIFYTYLLYKDVGDQNEHTIAVDTDAKRNLQLISMPNWERFYLEWKDGMIDGVPYQTCLTQDLFNLYCGWCHEGGEKTTTLTKLSSYIAKHESKKVAWYKYDIEHKAGKHTTTETIKKQGTVIHIGTNKSGIPDQDWFGQAISGFRKKIGRFVKPK